MEHHISFGSLSLAEGATQPLLSNRSSLSGFWGNSVVSYDFSGGSMYGNVAGAVPHIIEANGSNRCTAEIQAGNVGGTG